MASSAIARAKRSEVVCKYTQALTLNDLNADCIMEIYKYLPIMDLCAIRNTCTRLQTVADYFFGRQPRTAEFHIEGSNKIRNKAPAHIYIPSRKLHDVHDFLQNFGSLLSNLIINLHPEQSRCLTFDLVIRYCTNLVSLHFSSLDCLDGLDPEYDFDDDWTPDHERDRITYFTSTFFKPIKPRKLRKFLEHCTTLGFEQIDVDVIQNVLKFCTNLKELVLMHLENYNPDKFFKNVTKNKPQLKALKVIRCSTDFLVLPSALFGIFSKRLPNLESFYWNDLEDVEWTMNNLLCLLKLTKLKELRLGTKYGIDCNEFLRQLPISGINIEILQLERILVNEETSRSLCELKSLRVLILSYVSSQLDSKMCSDMATKLPNVTEFHANYGYFPIHCILGFVRHATSLKKLCWHQLYQPLSEQNFMELVEARRKTCNSQPLQLHLELEGNQHLFQLQKENKSTCNIVNLNKFGRYLKKINISDLNLLLSN